MFAAVVSVALYGLFVFGQTVRHRDYFLPVTASGAIVDSAEAHAPPPWPRGGSSLGLLLVSLVGSWPDQGRVTGDRVGRRGGWFSAVRCGRRDRDAGAVARDAGGRARRPTRPRADEPQSGARLGDGEHRPDHPGDRLCVDLVSGPIVLGLGSTQIVLLVLTVLVAILTVVPGRATLLQAGVHLVVFASFIFLAIKP